MRLIIKGLQALILAAAAFATTLLLEVIFLHSIGGTQGRPTALHLAALLPGPLLSAISGWRSGWRFEGYAVLKRMDKKRRALVGYSGLWLVSVCLFFSVFDPFGKYHWDGGEYAKFLFILLGPPVFGLAALRISAWVNNAGALPQQDGGQHAPR